jgi:hypothetical protein
LKWGKKQYFEYFENFDITQHLKNNVTRLFKLHDG